MSTFSNSFEYHIEQLTDALQVYQSEYGLTDKQVNYILHKVIKNICGSDTDIKPIELQGGVTGQPALNSPAE
jgi:hypothetical protein